MRIISGYFKKKKLLLPDQNITRPLRDYVKESIFNFLLHNKNIKFNFWQIMAFIIVFIIAFTIFSDWEQFKRGLLGLAP